MRETRISPESLIWPVFVIEGEGVYEEIPSACCQYHYSPDQLGRMVERAHAHGVSRVILFGLPAHKDERGSSAWDENGVVQQGIRKIKALAPEMYIVTDVCMCEYTSHGHCGILCGHDVDNDKTLEGTGENSGQPCARGRGHGRAERHDGRPRRGHPQGAG